MSIQAEHALRAIAVHVRSNSGWSVNTGNALPAPDEKQQKQFRITQLADVLEQLAVQSSDGHRVTYGQFEAVLNELHLLGFFPEGQLVSNVAQALQDFGGDRTEH